MKGDVWSRYVPRCGDMVAHEHHLMQNWRGGSVMCLGLTTYGKPYREDNTDDKH